MISVVIMGACYLAVMCTRELTEMVKTQPKSRVVLHVVGSSIALLTLVSLSLAYVLEHKV